MRLVHWETVIDNPDPPFAKIRERVLDDINLAIKAVVWPSGADTFTIRPESGKKRGEGNGVKPIKEAFVGLLVSRGWIPEEDFPLVDPRIRPPGPFDAFYVLPSILPFVAEWETGNVSSSHRALNKIAMGVQDRCRRRRARRPDKKARKILNGSRWQLRGATTVLSILAACGTEGLPRGSCG